jgi:hypothetical protein
MFKRRFGTLVLPAGILLLVGAGTGCFFVDAYQRAKQLRTYTNMQSICGNIRESRLEHGGTIDDATIEEILQSEAGGFDEWGHRLAYNSRRSEAGAVSYLLVSYGSDGKLDIEKIDGYYWAQPGSVVGHPERDIVFKDDVPLRGAGK